ncbi:hypothetical protein [Cellulosimicrobium cellulans]|uniref:hypothetical protein n=1 Tax=Cellulosimicrobium cellulans TaxID=1710 RepID=UPI0021CB982C|nr:hypothetical protein [Cellulosimicrobium cellulans]
MAAGHDVVPSDPDGPVGPAGPAAGDAPEAGRRSWRTGNRTLVVLAGVAAVSLVAGLGLSRLVLNPAEAAARTAPPEAGPITVPVESRELSNDVTVRGDVVFDDAVDLRVETADLGERAVVTGQVPEVGATLDAGSVALEVAGRPVLVLPGGLPTYRTLSLGVSGPDVLQLKAALGALGIGAGDATSDAYDRATAQGVAELYRRAGYPAPSPSDEAAQAVTDAERAVRSAQAEVSAAEGALASAGGGSGGAAVAQGDADIRSAERAVAAAQIALDACLTAPEPECGPAMRVGLQNDVDNARDQVGVAQAARAELDAAPNTSGERAALTAARDGLADAREALADAQDATVVALPASEVVFLETLPRRVDAVSVRRGGTVEGSVMSVSGATLQVVATAARADAALLTVGATGTAVLDGQEFPVTISAIEAAGASGGSGGGSGGDAGDGGSGGGSGGDAGAGRSTITLLPGELTPEQVAALQGSNVRVSIPVSSTGGAVLAVPLAALTAGPGGESRVEVMGDDDTTALVEVETGLAAGGYVEVTGAGGATLSEGDLVVIGQSGGATDAATGEPDEDAEA